MEFLRRTSRFHALANGLKVLCIPNREAPVVTYQTWFRVGARDEKLDPRLQATGLAHLFEHMMFRGTALLGDGEFDKTLAKNGVYNENATTWLDRTNYYESVPAEKLDLVMRLEADRMVNLVINETMLDTEREVVLGEYRMGLDDPDSVAFDHLYSTAFKVHPYRFTTIGTEEEIKRFSKSDADYFYRKFYAPNNAYILIVGDVDPDEVFHGIEKHYGSLSAQKIEHLPAPAEPEQLEERRTEFRHAQLEDPKVLIGYKIPEVTHADQAPLLLAFAHLAQGDSSILQDVWVDAGIAANSGGFLNQFKDPGLLVLMADLQPEKETQELLTALDGALDKMSASPLDLTRARNQYLLEAYSQAQENSALGSYIGEFIASAGDPLYCVDLIDAVKKVTAEDVKRVVDRYLRPTRRSVIIGLGTEEEAS